MFKELKIDGVKNLEDVVIPLSPLNVFVGANNQGKTAVIDAVGFALFPSTDDSISTNTGVAKVELTSDAGSVIRRVKKTGGGSGSLTVKGPDNVPVASPQTFLNSKFHSFMVNPVTLCTGSGKAKGQREAVYKIMEESVSLTAEEIKSISSKGKNDEESVKDFLDRVYTEAYGLRRDASVIKKKLQVIQDASGPIEDISVLKKKLSGITTKIKEMENASEISTKATNLSKSIENVQARISAITATKEELSKLIKAREYIRKDIENAASSAKKAAKDKEDLISKISAAKKELSDTERRRDLLNLVIDKGENIGACPVFSECDIEFDCPADVSTIISDAKRGAKKANTEIKKISQKIDDLSKKVKSEKDEEGVPDLKVFSDKEEAIKKVENELELKNSLEAQLKLEKAELAKLEKIGVSAEYSSEELDTLKAESRELSYSIRSAGESSEASVETELKEAISEYEKQDAIVKKAQGLKDSLPGRAKLPAGFELTDTGLAYKGIVLGSLSEKEKFVAAIRLIKMLFPNNRLICIDGFETFSKGIREKLLKKMSKDGYQYFVTIVGDKRGPEESVTEYLQNNVGCLVPAFYVEDGKFTKLEV